MFTGRQTGALARAHRVTQPGKTGPGRPLAHNRFIAGTLGVTAVQVTALLAAEPDVLEGVRFGAGAPLATPVTAQVGGRSWRDAIDVEDVMDLAVHLAAAALLTVAYLSGMRPQEKRAELHQMQHSSRMDTSEPAGHADVSEQLAARSTNLPVPLALARL